MRSRTFLIGLFVIGISVGCSGGDSPKDESRYITEEVRSGEVTKVDTRISSNGRSRPTLAYTTESADVDYYNPDTGTRSTYTLEVDRDSDGTLQRINFPSSGWLEVAGEAVDNGDGTETFVDDRGREFTVTRPEGLSGDDNEDDGLSNPDASSDF